MPDRQLPSRPNLEQYKKQAKELAKSTRVSLSQAQFVIAREHGFESWPKFAKHVETLRLAEAVASLDDPVFAFMRAACVPRDGGHSSVTLDEAEMILARYPHVATSNIYTAAILGDERGVRSFVARDQGRATAQGGAHGWDPLTYLCFSRYLRLSAPLRSRFVGTARVLLDAGASANTGWYEMIDHPHPRPVLESAIYGAAGIAQHAELTRLLLERGADPNDEELPYHVAETRDNSVPRVLLESGRLNQESLNTILLRKCDWHDHEGVKLLLDYKADPNQMTRWGVNALHQALRRDNRFETIGLLLDRGANPALEDRWGRSAAAIAARRGRSDVLPLFILGGHTLNLRGFDRLIAACTMDDRETIRSLTAAEPAIASHVLLHGGTLLAEFAGMGNVPGIRRLIELGVSPTALYREGDGYFGIAKDSTALHVAAWRARHEAVKELIARGAPVNAVDGRGRTALALAVLAGVDSYWMEGRSTDSAEALLAAGASMEGIELPTGWDEMDKLLHQHRR